MSYDIIIKNGTIVDGTGKPKFSADIGVHDGRIKDVTALGNTHAVKIIDATGKFVTPGFIDITNHSDTHLTMFKYPHLESLVMQGITTIIGGNCGSSLAPLASPEAIGGIRKWADPAEININWTTFEEYLGEIQKMRMTVNFGSFVGYGTLRRGIIGDEVRPLSQNERDQLKFLLNAAISQGAFGLSFGLSYAHERISPIEELIDAARVVAQTGGIIKIHLRSEGVGLLASINEVVRIGRETGASIQISHLKAIGKKTWPALAQALELVKNANASGLKINFDVSPYRTTGSLLYLLIPAGARYGGFKDLFRRINEPEERQKIIESMKGSTLHYDKILITSAKVKNIVGSTLAEIAARAEMSPEEALLETLHANEGRVSIIGRTLSLQNTFLEVKNESALVASDSAGMSQEAARDGNLTHPRSFGTFPRFWHRFVSEKTGVTPEEAVQKVCSGPAVKLGIRERGFLKNGYFADITVFDPRIIHDRATYKNPFRYPAGIEWVLVNGKVAVENGRFLDTRDGKVIRKS